MVHSFVQYDSLRLNAIDYNRFHHISLALMVYWLRKKMKEIHIWEILWNRCFCKDSVFDEETKNKYLNLLRIFRGCINWNPFSTSSESIFKLWPFGFHGIELNYCDTNIKYEHYRYCCCCNLVLRTTTMSFSHCPLLLYAAAAISTPVLSSDKMNICEIFITAVCFHDAIKCDLFSAMDFNSLEILIIQHCVGRPARFAQQWNAICPNNGRQM